MPKKQDAAKKSEEASEEQSLNDLLKEELASTPPQDQGPLIRLSNAVNDFSRQLEECKQYDLSEEVLAQVQEFLDIL
jgi:hypothetical protein